MGLNERKIFSTRTLPHPHTTSNRMINGHATTPILSQVSPVPPPFNHHRYDYNHQHHGGSPIMKAPPYEGSAPEVMIAMPSALSRSSSNRCKATPPGSSYNNRSTSKERAPPRMYGPSDYDERYKSSYGHPASAEHMNSVSRPQQPAYMGPPKTHYPPPPQVQSPSTPMQSFSFARAESYGQPSNNMVSGYPERPQSHDGTSGNYSGPAPKPGPYWSHNMNPPMADRGGDGISSPPMSSPPNSFRSSETESFAGGDDDESEHPENQERGDSEEMQIDMGSNLNNENNATPKYRQKRRGIEKKSRQRRFDALENLKKYVQQEKISSFETLAQGPRRDYQADICNDAVAIIRRFKSENESLRKEVNVLKRRLNPSGESAQAGSPIDEL